MIGILILTAVLLGLYIIYWWKKVKENENYKLHHEQEYPIVYIGDCKESDKTREWGVSMTGNTFIDGKNKKVDPKEYTGFIVKGNCEIIKEGDLIFVKKTKSDETLLIKDFPKLVIVKSKGHYLLRKAFRQTKSGKIVTGADLGAQKENKETIEYRTKIVGIVDYDFTIK